MSNFNENPFAAPQADDVVDPAPKSLISSQSVKVFSPLQIRAGAFFGGPFAASWLLRSNFSAIGKHDQARFTTITGGVVSALLTISLTTLHGNVPRTFFSIVIALLAGLLAERYQLKRSQISTSDLYIFQSNWRVVGVALIAQAAVVIAFAVYYSIDALNMAKSIR